MHPGTLATWTGCGRTPTPALRLRASVPSRRSIATSGPRCVRVRACRLAAVRPSSRSSHSRSPCATRRRALGQLRLTLIRASPSQNTAMLRTIERALFVVCLDDARPATLDAVRVRSAS